MAGPEHHHRTNVFKFHPGHIGKRGMRKFRLQRNHEFCPTINISKLWSLVSEQAYQSALKDDKKATVIDVTKAGYFKVLGKGFLPKVPVVVKAKVFSSTAEARIRATGGACVLTA